MDDLMDQLVEAWTNEGPHPEYHRAAKVELYQNWPILAKAVESLVAARKKDR